MAILLKIKLRMPVIIIFAIGITSAPEKSSFHNDKIY